MANPFPASQSVAQSDYPATNGFAITPSDTVNFTHPCRAIYVGAAGTGTLSVLTLGGDTLNLAGVVTGSIIPIACIRVNNSNTNASSLIGLY